MTLNYTWVCACEIVEGTRGQIEYVVDDFWQGKNRNLFPAYIKQIKYKKHRSNNNLLLGNKSAFRIVLK